MFAMTDVTRVLERMRQGAARAAKQLLPLVYDELRQLAARKLAQEKPGQTLQATALVHEAYLRLMPAPKSPAAQGEIRWDGRAHFFAAAAEAMRRILVENARRKRRRKHGGGLQRQELHPDLAAAPAADEEVLALDAALARLAQQYPVHARLVELRYFAGLTGDEAARLLDISPSTADRHWLFARAWLRRELRGRQTAKDF
jgi:RNA polymerase sigma factor (TIGR02999 family)